MAFDLDAELARFQEELASIEQNADTDQAGAPASSGAAGGGASAAERSEPASAGPSSMDQTRQATVSARPALVAAAPPAVVTKPPLAAPQQPPPVAVASVPPPQGMAVPAVGATGMPPPQPPPAPGPAPVLPPAAAVPPPLAVPAAVLGLPPLAAPFGGGAAPVGVMPGYGMPPPGPRPPFFGGGVPPAGPGAGGAHVPPGVHGAGPSHNPMVPAAGHNPMVSAVRPPGGAMVNRRTDLLLQAGMGAAGGVAGQAADAGGKKKKPGISRAAAGKKWVDPTLLEWPENDFRIFVGDLGNEVNDELLSKAFMKYPSFAKAKVVRDKHTKKTKGFGFVSFLESNDYAKALREMNGKYIGNRPCKLSKSSWTERTLPGSGKRKGGGHPGNQQGAKKAHK